MLLRSLPEFLGPSPVRFELDIDIGETLGRDFPQQAASIARRRPQPSLIGRAQCGDRPRTDRDGETPDDAGIEPVQILKYAARVIDLMDQLSLPSARKRFLEILSEAKSNRAEVGNGADIYCLLVEPLNPSFNAIQEKLMSTL